LKGPLPGQVQGELIGHESGNAPHVHGQDAEQGSVLAHVQGWKQYSVAAHDAAPQGTGPPEEEALVDEVLDPAPPPPSVDEPPQPTREVSVASMNKQGMKGRMMAQYTPRQAPPVKAT
jgi:hypothetical protein